MQKGYGLLDIQEFLHNIYRRIQISINLIPTTAKNITVIEIHPLPKGRGLLSEELKHI